ncbi:hypothetical protein BJY01DRAFT_175470 [Aspergillus pseudoustus]|uniref:Hydroxyneurosporene synthase n=1 Tax=Aspergillus pseudoustus TaxID=1810923 RepID=A0ABR4K218_9EURO
MKVTSLLPISLLFSPIGALPSTTVIPPTSVPERSDVTWRTGATGFDGPKVSPVNATTWDWWYFDAIQSPAPVGERASIVVTFYTASPGGFHLLGRFAEAGFTSLTLVETEVSWPNGTTEFYIFNATEATITVLGNGASGVFEAPVGAASFNGTPDMSTYRVDLHSPVVSGTVMLQSIVPPHSPCGAAVPGQNLQVAPHIGWANAIPAAEADVQLTVKGEELSFTGIGYHDKNWGDDNFASNVGAWYWGHGRLGDYTVVWFDLLSPNKDNYISAYVARGSEVIAAQCYGVKVRPYGENSEYPPFLTTGIPTGFNVTIDLPLEGQLFSFLATGEHFISGGPGRHIYTRWSGSLEGNIDGADLTGEAIFEQFKLFDETE